MEGLAVPARIIPGPNTVSEEAQAFLARGPVIARPAIPHTDKAMPHGGLSGTPPEDRELQGEIASILERKLGVLEDRAV